MPASSSASRRAFQAGQQLLDQGDAAGAETLWSAQLGRQKDAALFFALGSLYFREKRLARAQSCFERLARYAPQSAGAWYWLGLVRAARGDYRGAADAQRLAVGHAADFGPAYCVLALDLREAEHRGMADWAVRRALSLMPRYAGAWNLLGALEKDAGRFDYARQCFEEAIRLRPGYAFAWYNLAQLWERQGRDEKAFECYARALRVDPSLAEARLARAELSMDHGRFEAARLDFRACLGLDGWSPEAWWGLRRVDTAERNTPSAKRDLERYQAAQSWRDRAQERLAEQDKEEPSPYEPGVPGLPDFADTPSGTR